MTIRSTSAVSLAAMLRDSGRDVRFIRLGPVAVIWFCSGPPKDRSRRAGDAR